MGADSQGHPPSLLELVPSERWQRLQDHFAEVLGFGLRTVSADRRLLVSPSWPSGFDVPRITASFKLGEELEELLPADALPRETTTMSTPLGISFSVCPLRASPQSTAAVAYLVVGPVVLGRRDSAEQLRQRASSLGLDANALWPLMLSIRLYSFGNMRSVLRLLDEVGSTLLESSQQAKELQMRPGLSAWMDRAGARYYTDRLAQSLLDTAMAITSADAGSVMLFDPKRQALRIQASSGLAPETAARAELRPGEGLAGIAFAEQRTLLLDDRTTDDRLRQRMLRGEVLSSLVAPLVSDPGRVPVGVLSLRTSDAARRFDTEDVATLSRLLTLAGVALGSVRVATGQSEPPQSLQ